MGGAHGLTEDQDFLTASNPNHADESSQTSLWLNFAPFSASSSCEMMAFVSAHQGTLTVLHLYCIPIVLPTLRTAHTNQTLHRGELPPACEHLDQQHHCGDRGQVRVSPLTDDDHYISSHHIRCCVMSLTECPLVTVLFETYKVLVGRFEAEVFGAHPDKD